MELIIVIVVYNKPEFLPYQYKALHKFIKVPFKIIIFDNSDNELNTQQFVNKCNELNINYIRVPQNIHINQDASSRAGKSLDYALQYIYNIKFKGIVMVNDSDLFLIKEYNPIEQIENYEIVGRSVKNIYERDESSDHPININKLYYFSNQFLILNYNKINDIYKISFLPTILNGINLDCGGKLYEYMKGNIKDYKAVLDYCSGYNESEISTIDDLTNEVKEYLYNDIKINNNYKTLSEVFDNSFIHLRAGSNWLNQNNLKYTQRCENLYNLFYRIGL